MSQEEFSPRKKGIDEFTQEELEEMLHVDLAPDLSPIDFAQELKGGGTCSIVVDRNFNIYLGVTPHASMSTSLGSPSLLIDDCRLERRKELFHYDCLLGDFGMYFHANTYNSKLVKAVGNKVMKYLKSIGIQV